MHDTDATMIDVAAREAATRRRVSQALDVVVARAVLLDVQVGLRDVRLGLVVVVVADEVLDGVRGEELANLAAELRRERLVVGDHERGLLDLLDDPWPSSRSCPCRSHRESSGTDRPRAGRSRSSRSRPADRRSARTTTMSSATAPHGQGIRRARVARSVAPVEIARARPEALVRHLVRVRRRRAPASRQRRTRRPGRRTCPQRSAIRATSAPPRSPGRRPSCPRNAPVPRS